MTRRLLLSALSVLVLATGTFAGTASAQQPQPAAEAPGGPKPGPRPVRKDRVFARDLEGLWIARDYVEALRATRMPLAAAAKALPLTIQVKKDGQSYVITRTDFSRAVLLRVIEMEPGRKPDEFRVVMAENDSGPVSADEVTYLPVRGQKNAQGRFETLAFADPVFTKKGYRPTIRAEEGLGPLVNGIVLAGEYTDEQGRPYVFTAAGEASFPDGRFNYELALAPVAGPCEVLESPGEETAASPRKRYGFAWKAGRLQLFEVTGDGGKFRCARQPFATLKPKSGD